ncbi:MAG: hypothetical protein KKB21_04205 [Nanoarchaeota archaeon]|nr:hypothetical protein [Nanoarchaeota archaeon]
MALEKTVFFVKPYIDPKTAAEILVAKDSPLRERTDFRIVRAFATPILSLEFWEDFYSQVAQKHPVPFRKMCDDFASCQYGILGEVLEGEGVIEHMRDVMGRSRVIRENPKWTVRGMYDSYNNEGKEWRTATHASTPDEVAKDLEVLARHRIISL